MTGASLAKAAPGFLDWGDFVARRGLEFDFLRRREGFFGDMRAFFPGGITVSPAAGFDKRSGGGKKERRKSFATEDGTRATEDAEKNEAARALRQIAKREPNGRVGTRGLERVEKGDQVSLFFVGQVHLETLVVEVQELRSEEH